ncbi:hypothetical protein H0S70_06275 [Chryseobacterium manosquense]|uniref:Uncharacterized protein n=1 Tax=Chryseobacterium manosquense TaxID=2754694 RepID=A0A7H1E005_9FLAO|nr:hypothetical protein [Chryseobacterium manosquense]QNS42563.1 hypothetical protein H0S70_06275 [Chryseobacterium manosquense]
MSKESLEIQKLKLEIKKLNLPFWKNLEFWKVAFPTIAVIASLYFTFGKGLIDSEKAKLEIQKEQLKLDITRFEMKKDELSKTIVVKDSVKNRLQIQIENYEKYKKSLLDKIEILNNSLGNSRNEINNLNNKNLRDKKFYENKLFTEYQNEKQRLVELDKLEEENYNKNLKIAEINAEVKYLNSKIKLTEEEKLNLSILKNEASVQQYNKHMNSYKERIKKLDAEYQKELERIDKMSSDELFKEFQLQILKYNAEK